jgi:hypothetical protein
MLKWQGRVQMRGERAPRGMGQGGAALGGAWGGHGGGVHCKPVAPWLAQTGEAGAARVAAKRGTKSRTFCWVL